MIKVAKDPRLQCTGHHWTLFLSPLCSFAASIKQSGPANFSPANSHAITLWDIGTYPVGIFPNNDLLGS
jgi:hypothetical protein